MDCMVVAEWHLNQAKQLDLAFRKNPTNTRLRDERDFHSQAAKLLKMLHPEGRKARVQMEEIKQREGAAKSLAALSRILRDEAKALRQMYEKSPIEGVV